MTTASTFVLITGASRGFGRCLSNQLMQDIEGNVNLVLISRSEADLRESAAQAEQLWSARALVSHTVEISTYAIDLSDLSNLDEKMKEVWIKAKRCSRGLLFHNAGSLGSLHYTQDFSSLAELKRYNDFNITSTMWISKRFLELFGAPRNDKQTQGARTDQVPTYFGRTELSNATDVVEAEQTSSWSPSTSVIVNVSSLCATEPFHCMNMYCSSKAARLMHMRVIAKEQSHALSKLQTLSYSPGPMDTDMQREVRETESNFEGTRQYFQQVKEEGTYVVPTESAKVCIDLVLKGTFTSGAHIDYYDCVHSKREAYKTK